MSATITVPMIPPSVNHYVTHSRGRHFKTGKATRFLETLKVCSLGQPIVRAPHYSVSSVIWLGKGDRGDVDNFNKLILDGLVLAGVIDTDSKVVDLHTYKRRDAKEPARTEIIVKEIQIK
jgi:Endodeoxyribonuclease RusA